MKNKVLGVYIALESVLTCYLGEPVLPFDNIYGNAPGLRSADGQPLYCNYSSVPPEGRAECTMISELMSCKYQLLHRTIQFD
jgi:hypothetical protein